jgi:hypothetical protein
VLGRPRSFGNCLLPLLQTQKRTFAVDVFLRVNHWRRKGGVFVKANSFQDVMDFNLQVSRVMLCIIWLHYGFACQPHMDLRLPLTDYD